MTPSYRALAVAGLGGAPLVVAESRSRTRSPTTALAVVAALGLSIAVSYVVFSAAERGARFDVLGAARMAAGAYQVCAAQVIGAVTLGAFLASASISGERKDGTIDVLLASGMRPLRIVGSKAVATTAHVLLVLVAAAPVYVAGFRHAALPLGKLAMVGLLAAATVFTAVSLGTLLSAACPRSGTARLGALGLLLALALDVLGSGVLPGPLPRSGLPAPPGAVHPMRLLDPLHAIREVVTRPRISSVPLGTVARAAAPGGRRSSTWGPRVTLWQLTLAGQLAVSALALAAAARLVSPDRRNWRPTSLGDE